MTMPYIVLKCKHLKIPDSKIETSSLAVTKSSLTDVDDKTSFMPAASSSPQVTFTKVNSDISTTVDTDPQIEMLYHEGTCELTEKWTNEIKLQLFLRGFHVEAVHHDGVSHSFLLQLIKKRYQLQDAVTDNKGLTQIQEDSSYRYKLAQDSLDIIRRCTDANFHFNLHPELAAFDKKLKTNWDIWITHDRALHAQVPLDSPTRIKNYYGAKIGIYFAFLNYYSLSLGLLGVVGAIICYEHIINTKDFVAASILHDPIGEP